MKKLVFAFWAAALILTSCEKDKPAVVEIPPVAAFNLSRNFIYPITNTTAPKTYTGTDVNGKALTTEDKNLVIAMETPFPTGNDNVSFVIPQSKIKAGYIGEYNTQASTPETFINYSYKLTASSSNLFLPSAAQGYLKITKYDGKFKTLSGQFSFTINAQSDPISSAINNFRQTTIDVTGNFDNLKL